MENMALYSKLRSCPAEAQREIQAGKLKGKTDINPQWRIQVLTETFGPCGFGWVTEVAKTWTESAGDETGAYVLVNLYVRDPETHEWSRPITGIGGSKLAGKGKGDGQDDEAFKMAETDAISVCCKKLGIAADIYWNDGSKYTARMDARKRITTAMLEKGEINQLIDWMAKYQKGTDKYEVAKKQALEGYAWESMALFERFITLADKKNFVNDLNGGE